MTKNEFLKALENKLMSLSSTIRNDILNEYENHINEGMKEGESEEAVVATLGDPADIAEEILSVEDVEESDGEAEYFAMQSNLLQDIKPKEINMIDIKGEFLTIDIRNGDKFEMSFESPGEQGEFSHGVDGDKLVFRHESKKAKKVHFNILGFIRNKNYRSDKLTIVWPETLTDLKIRTDKGAVTLNGLTAKSFDVEADLGGVKVENIVGVKGELSSDMGAVSVKDSGFDDLKLSTDMGKVKADNVVANDQSYSTNMGAIDLKNAQPDSNITAHTDMGSINVVYKDKPTVTRIIAKTKMGSVSNQLENYIVENPEYTSRFTTSMGSVSIH